MPVRTIFDRAPIEEWFSSRVRGMQIAGRARLYLHTLKGTARAQPSRGHTAFQEWIYVRVSSSDFPIENAHRLPAKFHDISKYVPTNWFLPYLIPWFYLRKKCVQETYTILVFEDNFKYSNNEMFLSSMLFLTLKNVFTLSIRSTSWIDKGGQIASTVFTCNYTGRQLKLRAWMHMHRAASD